MKIITKKDLEYAKTARRCGCAHCRRWLDLFRRLNHTGDAHLEKVRKQALAQLATLDGPVVYFATQGSHGAYLNAEQVGKLYDVLGVWVRENGTPATAPLWEEI